jgi:hypothetical protein
MWNAIIRAVQYVILRDAIACPLNGLEHPCVLGKERKGTNNFKRAFCCPIMSPNTRNTNRLTAQTF